MRKDRVLRDAATHGVVPLPESHRPKESLEQLRSRIARAKWATDFPDQPFPEETNVMLAHDLTTITQDDFERDYPKSQWTGEVKENGRRGVLYFYEDCVYMHTRRRSDETHRFVDRSEKVQHLFVPGFNGLILDGEVEHPLESINTGDVVTENKLQTVGAIMASDNWKALQDKYGAVQFKVFHLIRCPLVGDCQNKHYEEMRTSMEINISAMDNPHITAVERCPTDESLWDFYNRIVRAGGEGIMLKHNDLTYRQGKRDKKQLKLKRFIEVDAWISGYLPGKVNTKNEGKVGAYEFSAYVDGVPTIVGHASNMTDVERDEVTAPGGSLYDDIYGKIYELRAQEWTKNKLLFHCNMVRPREDKTQEQCVVDLTLAMGLQKGTPVKKVRSILDR